jgi:predicted transposase/invertase (TIGR01784 family)
MSPDASIEEILASYRTNLESRNQLTQEDEELIMQLSETYLKRRQEWKAEGLEEGRQEGRQEGQQLALRSVAVSLLQEGVEATIIAKTTGLSIAAVEQLRQELGN